MTRQGDQRKPRMVALEVANRFGGAGAGHEHVRNHQRRRSAVQFGYSGAAILRLAYLVASALQPVGDQIAQNRIIVDDEDFGRPAIGTVTHLCIPHNANYV